jgi:polyisoprenoid-binding protein YceI
MLHRSRWILSSLLLAALCAAASAFAQEMSVELDPGRSRVEFTLGDVLHTVHGGFQLKSGVLHFDERNGAAAGELTLDAASGESGSKGRDHKMHQQVLESAKYPDITFQPQRVIGHFPSEGAAQMEIDGLLIMHGQTHPMTAAGPVQVNGEAVTADLRLVVPYEQWGMKNPSTLFLRVSDKVEITVHAVGRLAAVAASSNRHSSTAPH